MNTLKSGYVKTVVIFSLIIPLSACYSLSSLWSDTTKNDKTTNISNSPSRFMASDKSETNVDEFIQEWESVRPALMRVVALEEDMQFLLQSMSDVNETGPVYNSTDTNFLEFPSESSFEQAQVNNFVDMGTQAQDKFSQAQLNSGPVINRSSDKVEARPAPKILNASNTMDGKFTQQNHSQIDNKFSGNQQKSSYSQNSAQINSLQEIARSPTDCSDYTNNIIGKGNAIHLVSYKSKQSLREGSTKLSKQYSEELCGKMPLFKEVVVNGSRFYSMRFGPFKNKDDALKACSKIKNTGQYCGVTDFDGDRIL